MQLRPALPRPGRGPGRRRSLVVLLVALALMTTGCFRSTTTVQVADDGSGTVELVLAVDPATVSELSGGRVDLFGLEQAEPTPEAAGPTSTLTQEEVCDEVGGLRPADQLPPDTVTEPYEADGLCGQRITFPFADSTDLAGRLAVLGGVDAERTAQEVVLEPVDGGWRFEAPAITPDTSAVADASEVPQAVIDTALSTAEVTYTVVLPGSVIDGATNADDVDPGTGTFRWFIDLADPPERLEARTGPPGAADALTPTWILAGLAGLVVVGGLVGFQVLRRRTPPDGDDERWGDEPEWAAWDDADRPVPAGRVARGDQVAHRAYHHGAAGDWDDQWPADDDHDPWAGAGWHGAGNGSGWYDANGSGDSGGFASNGHGGAEPAGEPWWDDEWQLWVADDSAGGVVWYDETSDQWYPV